MPTMFRLKSALLSIVLLAVLALGADVNVLAVAAGVLLVQVLIAAAPSLGDSQGRSIPTPRVFPALAAGLVATGLALFPEKLQGADGTQDALDATTSGSFAGVLLAVAFALLVTALTQMARRDGRRELTGALSYAMTLAVAAALAAGWIGASESVAASAAVLVGAVGGGVGLLAWSIPGDRIVIGALAIVAGAGAGALVPVLTETIVTPLFGVAVGSGAALFAILGQILGRALISGRRHASASWGFPGAMSVALAGPVVYIGGQLVASVTL